MRDLIRQAWHADPLLCAKCWKSMSRMAVIDRPEVAEGILRHLLPWCGPARFAPAWPPPDSSTSLLPKPEPDHLAGSDSMRDAKSVITE